MRLSAAPVGESKPLAAPVDKQGLRALFWQRRRLIPTDLADTTRWKVVNNLRTVIGRMGSTAVALYYPQPHEIDLRPLAAELWRDGMTVLLPRVAYRNFPLVFNVWCEGAPLERDAIGLWAATGPEVLPGLIVVPMVGYTRDGYRLGSGGGYYDQTLAALPCPVRTVGVCHTELELVDFPHEPHDIQLDVVVTGKEVIWQV